MGDKKQVPVYCYQCVAGPDLLKVEVEDGVATRIASNFDIREEHPGGGRVCVKAYGLIQKTYNPNRISTPMKRTNPKKGRNEDPGFVPISWDEALDAIAAKLKSIFDSGLSDESGFPKIAASFGGGGTPTQYMGTFPALLSAFGKVDLGFGAGQGVKCYHSEHLYGELWHRAFIVAPDSPRTNFILSFGHNGDASAGVTGIWRQADARARGMKRIQVEPHLSVTGAVAAQWVPIKPKTDAAFLFAMLHRILHEHSIEAVCDIAFLKQMSNSPYLVGPGGYFLRHSQSRKPLVFDQQSGQICEFDKPDIDPALVGEHVADGFELGPDGAQWEHQKIAARTSLQCLIDHVKPFTPGWAEAECDVPAARIREVTDEFLAHACIGETVEIDGVSLPHRPVAILLGKTVNNGWGGYQCCWARTMLASLVGALEVPGGIVGTNVKLNRPANNRQASAVRDEDGFMHYPFNETSKEQWQQNPKIRNAYNTLVPLASDSAWSAALGPAHLPWLFLKKNPPKWPKATTPDIWFQYRTNPAISSWNAEDVTAQIAKFPFIVSFAYTRDETNHMADILLPESTDLESLQLIQIGNTKFIENLWHHEGWAIRQPAADRVVDSRDMSDIATDIAERAGILEKYNAAINRGAAGMKLVGDDFDYQLDETVAHDVETIWNSVAKAASHDLSNGKNVRDIEWFKEHGYMLREFEELNWFLYPHMQENNIRFEMPYQERITRHGTQLAHRLSEAGVTWWDKQLREYEPLPGYQKFPDIWTDYVKSEGGDPEDYPFWALTARSMQYSWGANVGIPLMNEVANNISGHRGVIINREAADRLMITEGDPVVIRSIAGVTRGRAVVREGIRPDTILMIGQFDHWATPFAKDLNLPSLNSVQSLAIELTDATGSTSDIARVSVAIDREGARRRD